MSLRVEVSLSVVSLAIEDRDEVEVDNWVKQKKTFYSRLPRYFVQTQNFQNWSFDQKTLHP
jgi:hypothetical protein